MERVPVSRRRVGRRRQSNIETLAYWNRIDNGTLPRNTHVLLFWVVIAVKLICLAGSGRAKRLFSAATPGVMLPFDPRDPLALRRNWHGAVRWQEGTDSGGRQRPFDRLGDRQKDH